MATIEVEIPDTLYAKMNRLIEDGEFLNEQEAVNELISSGITAYQANGGSGEDDFTEVESWEDDPIGGSDDDPYAF